MNTTALLSIWQAYKSTSPRLTSNTLSLLDSLYFPPRYLVVLATSFPGKLLAIAKNSCQTGSARMDYGKTYIVLSSSSRCLRWACSFSRRARNLGARFSTIVYCYS